jgi:hypothetical protein
MRLAFRFAPRFALALALAAPLFADSALRLDFAQLSSLADRVVAGRITKVTAAEDPRNGYIYSTVTLAVSQAVPEQLAGREYSFRMIGGEANGRVQYLADYPKLPVGSDVVLFLDSNTASVFGPTVGLGQGVFYLDSSPYDKVQRVTDRYGQPVLAIRAQKLIRGVRRDGDPATAALATTEKGMPAMPLNDFFEQVRNYRARPAAVR